MSCCTCRVNLIAVVVVTMLLLSLNAVETGASFYSMTVTDTTTAINYGDVIKLAFAMDPPDGEDQCNADSVNLQNINTKVYWTDPLRSSRVTIQPAIAPNPLTLTINDATWSENGTYSASCEDPFYKFALEDVLISVNPNILNISASDAFGNPRQVWPTVVAGSGFNNSNYSMNLLIDSNDLIAIVSFYVGNGYYIRPSATAGGPATIVPLHDFVVSDNGGYFTTRVGTTNFSSFNVGDYVYPNMTIYDYSLSATALMTNCECSMNAVATSTMPSYESESLQVASLNVSLSYAPQNVGVTVLRTVSTDSQIFCIVACQVKTACPPTVDMSLYVIGRNSSSYTAVWYNRTSLGQSVSCDEGASVQIQLNQETCATLAAQAAESSSTGNITCIVTNSIGTIVMTSTLYKAGFDKFIEASGLDWWAILLIALGGVIFVVLFTAVFVLCVRRQQKAKEEPSNANDGEPPEQVAIPVELQSSSFIPTPLTPTSTHAQHFPAVGNGYQDPPPAQQFPPPGGYNSNGRPLPPYRSPEELQQQRLQQSQQRPRGSSRSSQGDDDGGLPLHVLHPNGSSFAAEPPIFAIDATAGSRRPVVATGYPPFSTYDGFPSPPPNSLLQDNPVYSASRMPPPIPMPLSIGTPTSSRRPSASDVVV